MVLFEFAGDLKSLTGDFKSLLATCEEDIICIILGGDAKSFLEIYFMRLGLRSDYDNRELVIDSSYVDIFD